MKENVGIPRCMSTQHPDNITIPFFAEEAVLGGEDEIKEAYYAFSHLGCAEQMWDCEGKEVDTYVVKKLLSRYESFFRSHRLGEEVFLTLRGPNPTIEKTEAKVLLETLESIPRSFDAARRFYGEDVVPIFEVILPMTSSHRCLNRIYHYYRDFVAGKEDRPFYPGDVTVGEWIGSFMPKEIRVIPLIEDTPHMLAADRIVGDYLKDKAFPYQRVFLARSDPALNYGSTAAVLVNKIALQRLHWIEESTGVPIYPIIGVGSAPFRGNFKPSNCNLLVEEYPSVQTYTIQSAFKYDYEETEVREAIGWLNVTKRRPPLQIEEGRAIEVVEKLSARYAGEVGLLAPLVDRLSRHVPDRRKRRLHIGLFGYSRTLGEVRLPRAIKFCSSLYSIGLPPELLGLSALEEEDIRFVKGAHRNFAEDLRDALRFFNERAFEIVPPELREPLERVAGRVLFERDEAHAEITSRAIDFLKEGNVEPLRDLFLAAARVRRFLG